MEDLQAANLLYRCPELYDQLRGDDTTTATLCAELLDAYGPAEARTVLDLGCGTGCDLAQLLAGRLEEGVGVDLQPQMIAYAHQAHPTLDIRLGDVRTFRLGQTVDLILCVGNVLGYLHANADQHAAFTTFAAHAHPGNLLVLYLPVAPSLPALTQAPPRTCRVPDFQVEVALSYTWDLRAQVETMHRHWQFDDGDRQAHDRIARRILGPRELDAYLAAAGFQTLEMFDDPADRQRPLRGPGAYAVARSVALPSGAASRRSTTPAWGACMR